MYIYSFFPRLSNVLCITGYNVLLFHLWSHLNHLTISFPHHWGGLVIGQFWSLRYHLTTAPVHLLSVNLTMCLAQKNFSSFAGLLLVFYNHILHFTNVLINYLNLDVFMSQYFLHGSFHSHQYCNQPLLLHYHGTPHFAYVQHHRQNSAIEEVDMSCPVLPFIMVNAPHLDLTQYPS